MCEAPGSSIQLIESMNQGQKIQMLESFEEANFNNAFEDICVARYFSDPTAFGSFTVTIKLFNKVPCHLATYFMHCNI